MLETVLAAAQRHTAYARHQLPVDADLESELGIDSVLLASVLADAARDLGLAHGLADGLADSLGASTLRGLADGLRAARDAGGPAAPAAPAAQEDPSPQAAPEWDGRSMKDFVEKRDPDLFAKTRSFAPYLRRREAEHLYWYGMPLRSRCGNKAVILDDRPAANASSSCSPPTTTSASPTTPGCRGHLRGHPLLRGDPHRLPLHRRHQHPPQGTRTPARRLQAAPGLHRLSRRLRGPTWARSPRWSRATTPSWSTGSTT
ncbi:hypothetical protein AB7952_07795 [Streptomyces sp. PG2]